MVDNLTGNLINNLIFFEKQQLLNIIAQFFSAIRARSLAWWSARLIHRIFGLCSGAGGWNRVVPCSNGMLHPVQVPWRSRRAHHILSVFIIARF